MERKSGIWEHNFLALTIKINSNLFVPMEFRVRNNELSGYR